MGSMSPMTTYFLTNKFFLSRIWKWYQSSNHFFLLCNYLDFLYYMYWHL